MKQTRHKTLAAGIGGLLTVLGGALVDGALDGGDKARLITELIGFAGTAWAVYKTRNRPLPPENTGESPLV